MKSSWLTLSSGIRKIPYIDDLFDVSLGYRPFAAVAPDADAIVGWGRKPTSIKARLLAKKRNCPYVALEDGFLRSLDLGVNGALAHSLIADFQGIYYDATQRSDLESLIAGSELSESQTLRAQTLMDAIKSYRLSKYNLSSEQAIETKLDVPSVLLVDQTYGDASVEFGMADQSSFEVALHTALSHNPTSEIWIKVHPDVIAGKKRGYLLELLPELPLEEKARCRVISEDINPWCLFDVVSAVYVVTSQMGFEALMAGLPVHCFGMPFYAGWGLTIDSQSCERRGKQRTLEQLFHAAYIKYPRYINPYTRQCCEIEDTVQLLSDQRRKALESQGNWKAVGFGIPKRWFIHQFLGPLADVKYCSEGAEPAEVRSISWASRSHSAVKSESAGGSVIEDGFIRSSGLGVDLIRPLSLVIDNTGIYYDCRSPSDLESLLNQHEFDSNILERATVLRKSLISSRISKYNVGSSLDIVVPKNKRVILVPGQVESDASIACGSPQIQTNKELLALVRKDNPNAWIIYKPHPDVVAGARLGSGSDSSDYDQRVVDTDIIDLIDQVDEIHTMTSLTGFEALMRGKPVTTYGLPFYAGWGLTRDKLECPRRNRVLTLDMLIAGALILYPVYVDPETHELVNVETAVSLLAQYKEKSASSPWWVPLYRLYRRLFEHTH